MSLPRNLVVYYRVLVLAPFLTAVYSQLSPFLTDITYINLTSKTDAIPKTGGTQIGAHRRL